MHISNTYTYLYISHTLYLHRQYKVAEYILQSVTQTITMPPIHGHLAEEYALLHVHFIYSLYLIYSVSEYVSNCWYLSCASQIFQKRIF